MDKQDAIDFIVEQFEQGRSPSEIAEHLSADLNAPHSVVLKFVNRTLDQRMVQFEPDDPPPPAPRGDAGALPQHREPVHPLESQPAAETAPQQPSPASESQAAWAVEPPRFDPSPPSLPPVEGAAGLGSASTADAPAAHPTASTAASIDPQLEKFILSRLSSRQKNSSDLIIAVCERAGIDWMEAQRMIGYVETRNRRRIATRRNMFMIPFSLLVTLAGLALIWAVAQEAAPYLPALQSFNDQGLDAALQSLPTGDSVSPRTLMAYAGLGLSLAVGGLVGLIRAIRSQFE